MPWLLLALIVLIALLGALAVAYGSIVGRRTDGRQIGKDTDPVTGFADRDHFQRRLSAELEPSSREGRPLSLLLIDLDALGELSARGGNLAAIRALRTVAETLRSMCGPAQIVARLEENEFAVLVEVDGAQALELAERIRTALLLQSLERRGVMPPTSLSIGVTTLDRVGSYRPDAFVRSAAEALSLAKARGRDCAVLAQP